MKFLTASGLFSWTAAWAPSCRHAVCSPAEARARRAGNAGGLTAIHTDYANAGADILLANTFGANAKKLTGCGHTVEEVVSASIACARKAAETTGACVALDIGPLGELLVPAGTLAFEDAYNEFAQVIRAGAAAGADLVF